MSDTRCRCGGTEDHDWLCAPREALIVLSAEDWRAMERAERRADIGDDWEEDERLEREKGEP